MINITDPRSRLLWQAEIERMMSTLEYSQTKDWNRLFNSQYFKASRLAKVGRFDDVDFIIDDARPKMLETLNKHYRRIATVFSNKAFGILATKKFIQPSEIKTPMEDFWKEMNKWRREQAGKKITQISKTSKGMIAKIIHKGMQEQLSHVDIAKNIRKTGKIVNPSRARMIALTETHTAAVKSIDSAVKSTRIEMEREWVSARDTRTRRPGKYNIWNHYGKFPSGADGERVPQDKDFVGTGQPLKHPGDPKGAAGNIIRCLTNYATPIFTSEGWKQVRYIKPGDLVLTHKNRFKKVLRLNKSLYEGEVVRISLEGQGKFIIVTPNHPFLVSRGSKFFRWKNAEDIMSGEIVRFMASYCQWCGEPIPYYNKFCDKYCAGKKLGEGRINDPKFSEERRQVALKQWTDPEHRKNISKKASAQLKREYANGIRDGDEITKKAREVNYAKWGPGGSMGVLIKTEKFQKIRREGIKKKYGSVLNMLKQTAFPALGRLHANSTLEQAMASFLVKKGKEFVAQFPVGRRRIDFYVEKEKMFIEVDGYPWHEDKERDRKRDLEILTKYPDHRVAHVDYKPNPPKWEFFDLVSLNHSETFTQIGMSVRSVSKRVLKRRINIYNFAVEGDESYIANGFVIHNCRCVLLYHTVKRMEKLPTYEPPESLGNISIGSPVKSAKEVANHYEGSKKATFIEGKSTRDLKIGIEEKLGKKMYSLKSKEMDDFIRPLSNRIATQDMVLEDYEVATGNLIRQWAFSSGDTNPKSIMMQLAAKKEFGLEGTTIWWEKEALKEAQALFKIHEKASRRFLREMYNDTQEHLKKRGLKTVRVARGYKGDIGIKPSTVEHPISKVKIELQPMSSFSSDVATAKSFTNNVGDSSMLFVEAPIDRILSIPVTGFGCKKEFEYVILGTPKKAETILSATIKKDQFKQDFVSLFRATSTTLSEEEAEFLLTEKIIEAIHGVTK